MTTHTIEITSQEVGVYHIPGHDPHQTLCGYVDCSGSVEHIYKDAPCNCSQCIEALRAIKALRFPKKYFFEG